ncbi:MAG: RNA 2',3'-cyclic phosphodiesterase [Bdellovibrionaceae bacterium]|nr:RNA 2',3'-cyclic phosphodiesterase [Pseudobdellovibrionaceae bacterium]
MKRLFLAIAAHDGLENTVSPIMKKLRINADKRELDVRWNHPSHFHVTLVFLGNTADIRIPELELAIDGVSAVTPPFDLKITGMGAFPDDVSSRVIWFGVQNSKHLRFFQEQLLEQLRTSRFPVENRDYFPHLTVARFRNPTKTKDMTSPFVRKSIAKIPVTEIVLYESVGGPPFRVYKALKTFSLRGVREDSESADSTDTTESTSQEPS